jgi:hypothetical protein
MNNKETKNGLDTPDFKEENQSGTSFKDSPAIYKIS